MSSSVQRRFCRESYEPGATCQSSTPGGPSNRAVVTAVGRSSASAVRRSPAKGRRAPGLPSTSTCRNVKRASVANACTQVQRGTLRSLLERASQRLAFHCHNVAQSRTMRNKAFTRSWSSRPVAIFMPYPVPRQNAPGGPRSPEGTKSGHGHFCSVTSATLRMRFAGQGNGTARSDRSPRDIPSPGPRNRATNDLARVRRRRCRD